MYFLFQYSSFIASVYCPLFPPQKWSQQAPESYWLQPYSSLDSVKCVMGYTQRFTTVEHKVAPLCMGSVSIVWVFLVLLRI